MKLTYFLFFSFVCASVNAQQIHKKIINANGATYHSNGVTLQASVGEPIVGSFETATVTTLSQGFFTGSKKKGTVIGPPIQPIPQGYSIYPNPVKDVLFIRGNLVFVKQLQFFDVAGHRLFARNLDNSGAVSVHSLPAGFYLAKLTGKSDEVLNVFKIIKL